MTNNELEGAENIEDVDVPAGLPPEMPRELSQDERYFMLFATAIRKCKLYKPKFGHTQGQGWTVQEFIQNYQTDPFYHWIGIDSPLMYAAHKAAGGMTSVYRQIGIGSQWIFYQILQDHLQLSAEQATWSYTIERARGKPRKFSLDGRIDLDDITDANVRTRIQAWINDAGAAIGLPNDTLENIKGVVFEARQGYKSKDSGRQDKDIANAGKAYAHLYIPVILLFSTQVDGDVANRYRENLWLLLTGTTAGTSTDSIYTFCREVIGYDLADFFNRYSQRIKTEIEDVLSTLLTA